MILFKKPERGQALGEYALIISFASIVALAIITVLVNPQDWRNGIIYKGIYRPVQCAVQGISRDNCQDASRFSAVRYPSVADGNTRKLCNDGTYVSSDASDPWTVCTTGGGPETITVEAPQIINIIIFSDLDGAQTPGRLSDGAERVSELYDFGVEFGEDSSVATSVEFDIEKQTGVNSEGDPIFEDYARGGVSGRTDNAAEFLLNERNGIELVADGTDASNSADFANYRIRVTPYRTENIDGSDVTAVGDSIVVGFVIKPNPAISISIASVSFVTPGSGGNEREIQAPPASYYEGSYAVKVDVNGEVHRLTFDMQGPVPFNANIASQSATYYPFGATNGILDGQSLTQGTYTLTVRAFDVDDNQADEFVRQFEIAAVPTEFSVTGFEYVDANNEQTIDTLSDGDTIVLTDQDSVNFVGLVGADDPSTSLSIGSVSLALNEINGSLNASLAENVAPYAVFGDTNGNFNGRVLAAGEYLLSATPYSDPDASGDAGPTKSIRFTVERPPEAQGPIVSAFKLMNLNDYTEVRTLTDGDEIVIPGYNWNIRTEITQQDNAIKFVEYELSGDESMTHKENHATYDFPGSTGGNAVLNLQAGSYALTVTAYDVNDEPGPTETLNFTVTAPPVICDDTRAVLKKVKCETGEDTGYYINMRVLTYCNGDDSVDVTNPSDAAPTSIGGWGKGGDKWIHNIEWNNTATDPNTSNGYYWGACNEGMWDPITLEIDFGGQVNEYSINLGDYPGDNNLNLSLTPN